jgi:hypothetical protein
MNEVFCSSEIEPLVGKVVDMYFPDGTKRAVRTSSYRYDARMHTLTTIHANWRLPVRDRAWLGDRIR